MLKINWYADNINVFRDYNQNYYAPGEHNPPHIHGYYQDSTIVISIHDCEVLQGQMPVKQLRLIQAWIEIHREELLGNWELCQNGEKPFQIEPLK